MKKQRKQSKKAAAAILAAAMLIGSSTTAFAYVDPAASEETSAETEAAPETTPETGQTDSQKPVLQEENASGTAFSTPGNAQLQDDLGEDSSKEFLTITTKNNNTFYLVIDRSAATENVYMLSQIDENDLQEFLDGDTASSIKTEEAKVVLDENQKDTEDGKTDPNQEEKAAKETAPSSSAGLIAVLLLAGAGAAAYYYFKIRKKKAEDEEADTEGIELNDGLETVDEQEEAEEENEEE